MRIIIPALASALLFAPAAAAEAPLPDEAGLRAMTARFAPVTVKVDTSALPANEKLALAKMVEAARIFDALFYRQVAPLNETWLAQLVTDETPLGRARLHYFALNKGPWSILDEHRPFLPGVGPKPPGASFYPADSTRAEIETWIKTLPAAEQEQATGFFSIVRRKPDGSLFLIPYNIAYQSELLPAAQLLREAAAATTQPTLKNFLEKRARGFLTNDYYDSDMAWMELDATIEPTIGPYETYQDEWFNYKAAFEAFICLNDAAETAKLARFSAELQGLEDRLPIDPKYRRAQLGGLSPIRVVNVVFNSGDGNRGIQTAAFNLPNDERVVAAKGSKRVMLKNYQEAKFSHVLVPISSLTLAAADQPYVAFDPFFTHILMHELMHGLGPQEITVNGRATTVRLELKELNSTLEEAKADISGLWALQQLMDKGVLDKTQERAMYVTFLASSFRTLRFGLGDAHAKGMALQLNWLLDTGGFTIAADGRFAVDFAKIKQGVASLTTEIMTLQATGDYARGKALMDRLVVIRPQVKTLLARCNDLPVDIEPRFATEL
ncbi:MAG: hypothetical protein HYX71_03175 [Opitutae bacterium]|nr:hypothetical protein [Opitutae bacterium]